MQCMGRIMAGIQGWGEIGVNDAGTRWNISPSVIAAGNISCPCTCIRV